MEKEFIPYEQALALKKLEFDEPCFGFYTEEYKKLIKNFCKYPINLPTKPFLAPTFSQAFRWFREKGIDIEFKKIEEGYTFHIFKNQEELTESILKLFSDDRKKYTYKTYEEAELECLKKLIEIVKDGENR